MQQLPNSSNVPKVLPCDKCGEPAPVVLSKSRHGEQLVLARIDGKVYATVDCAQCGNGLHEVALNATGK